MWKSVSQPNHARKTLKSEPHSPTPTKEFKRSSAYNAPKWRPLSVPDLDGSAIWPFGNVDTLAAEIRHISLGRNKSIRPDIPVEIFSPDQIPSGAPAAPRPNERPISSNSGGHEVVQEISTQQNGDALVASDDADAQRFAKQVRTARKSIKDVLLRRTQLLHAHQGLEVLRKDFHAQVDKLVISAHGPDPFSPSPRAKTKRRKKSKSKSQKKAQGDVTPEKPLDSSNVNISSDEKPTKHDGSSHTQKTEEDANKASGRSSFHPIGDEFYSAYSKLCEQERMIKLQVDELTNLEYGLGERLGSILSLMRSTGFADVLRAEMFGEGLSISDTASRRSSVYTTDPLLARYFSKAGDVGIYKERIQELEMDHEEGAVVRELLAERGEEVIPSDEDFEHNHRMRRKQLEFELNIIRNEAEDLKRQCLDQGLDVNPRRTAPPSVYTESRDQISSDHSESVRVRRIDYRSNLDQVGSTSSERVLFWMDKMEPDLSAQDMSNDFYESPIDPWAENDGGVQDTRTRSVTT